MNPIKLTGSDFVISRADLDARHELFVNQMPDSLAKLETLQEHELAINRKYRCAWNEAVKFFENMPEKCREFIFNQYGHQNVPKIYIAVLCYTMGDIHEDFKDQTRRVHSTQDFVNYNYKSFFTYLYLASFAFSSVDRDLLPVESYRGEIFKYDVDVSEFAFPYFASTSVDKDVAKTYAKHKVTQHKGTLFTFNGQILGSFSMDLHTRFDGEEEFLVWPFAYFKVENSFGQKVPKLSTISVAPLSTNVDCVNLFVDRSSGSPRHIPAEEEQTVPNLEPSLRE